MRQMSSVLMQRWWGAERLHEESLGLPLYGNQPVLLGECFYDNVLVQDFLRAGPGVELDAGGICFAPVHYFYAVHRCADADAVSGTIGGRGGCCWLHSAAVDRTAAIASFVIFTWRTFARASS